MNEEKYCYVATFPCGCRLCVTVDDPEIISAKETAKVVAGYIRDGGSVSRETVGEFRKSPFGHIPGCQYYKEPEPKQERLAFG